MEDLVWDPLLIQEFMIEKFKNYLTKDDKVFIKQTLLGPNFSYYLNDHTVKTDLIVDAKNYFFSHSIILRPEDRQPNMPFNSEYYKFFMDLVTRVVKKLNIQPKEFYRMALNLTFANGMVDCPEHRDHDYEHKNLILYLNDCDKTAKTIIKEDSKKIQITPTFNTGVYFEDNLHSMINPKYGVRLILVTTFI